jgi:peptidoglycan/LPS O-acetylase OafA/YrhL
LADANYSDGMTPQRLLGLDILRSVAVLLVLGRHMPEASGGTVGKWLYDGWHRGGWIGVDLFFVLSGFLVSGLLFSEYKKRGSLAVGRFLIRRGWKIYPAFLVFILATIFVRIVFKKEIEPSGLLAELTFCQSYFRGLWAHTWSLSVEEHFYLLLPFILLGLAAVWGGEGKQRNPFASIPLIAIAVATACLLLRLSRTGPFDPWQHVFPSVIRIDSLFFGVAIAYFWHFKPNAIELIRPCRWLLIAAGVAGMLPAFWYSLEQNSFMYQWGFTVLFLSAGAILLGVLLCESPKSRFAAWIAGLGFFSYSVYLWHVPVVIWGMPVVRKAVPLPFAAETAIYIATSFAVGIVMAKLVEMPALALRDRLFPATHPATVVVETSAPSDDALAEVPLR